MNIKTFEFGATLKELREYVDKEATGEHVRAPISTIASEIVTRVRRSPATVYIFSEDDDREDRNHFAYALTKSLLEYVPSALLVDCDFLQIGMSGLVPERDALGFLDLLLYGSSLGVILQEGKGGVRLIGAGSFPVSKKSPFVMEAFEDARRYLVSQAKCVIFSGPSQGDEGEIHPMVQAVDLPVLVSCADAFFPDAFHPLEERVSAVTPARLWSVRISRSVASREAVTKEEAATGREVPTPPIEERPPRVIPLGTAREEEPVEAPRPSRDAGSMEWVVEDIPGAGWPDRSTRSFFPKLLTSVLGVALVAFLLWWLYVTKSVREPAELPGVSPPRAEVPPEQPPPVTGASGTAPAERVAGGDTLALGETEAPQQRDTAEAVRMKTEKEIEPTKPVQLESPGVTERLGEPKGPEQEIAVSEGLKNYSGRYVVHVSSFRRLDEAEEEASFFSGRGFPVFIVHIDLGSKGLWYRVYVGPAVSLGEAENLKLKLDEIPRVKFTSVSKVP